MVQGSGNAYPCGVYGGHPTFYDEFLLCVKWHIIFAIIIALVDSMHLKIGN